MWHDGLRIKLTQLNFPIILTRWISEFLNNRTAKVKCNNQLSNTILMQAGAPQGSTISPTLYNLFVNDIPQPIFENVGLAQFADNTSYWSISPKTDCAAQALNKQLKLYTDWTHKWRISINMDKTQTMHVKHRRKHRRILNKYPIIIENKIIPYSSSIQYLGITITDKLKLHKHIQTVIKRTQPALQTIQYTSRKHSKLTKHTRLNLYKSIVRSSLTFAALLLLSITAQDKEKIEILHRKAIRNCLNLPRSYPNRYLFQASRVPNLSDYIN